jgi:hypothetical protein
MASTLGAFGNAGPTLTATFTNGANGVYYFGTDASLTNESFELADFSLYPNPNNGNFNVRFNSDSSNDINIAVHDIQGRLILNNKFTNTGLFNQNIELNNAQTGIYLVTVQDGDKKVVRRVVIK